MQAVLPCLCSSIASTWFVRGQEHATRYMRLSETSKHTIVYIALSTKHGVGAQLEGLRPYLYHLAPPVITMAVADSISRKPAAFLGEAEAFAAQLVRHLNGNVNFTTTHFQGLQEQDEDRLRASWSPSWAVPVLSAQDCLANRDILGSSNSVVVHCILYEKASGPCVDRWHTLSW